MKRAWTILLTGALLLLALTACGKAPAADFRSVQDTGTEKLLDLGMSQAAAEAALGGPLVAMPGSADYYCYPSLEEPLCSLGFGEDALQVFSTKSPAFTLQDGFGVGSQIAQLGDGWVLTQLSDSADAAFRYFDGAGSLLLEATEEAVVMQALFFYDGSEAAGEAALYTLD